MKISIDIRSLQANRKTGVWVYTQNLIEAISRIDKNNIYYLIGSGIRVKKEDIIINIIGPNFQKIILRIPDREFMYKDILWNNFILPTSCLKRKIDIFHQPAGHSLPRYGKFKKIITIHDLRTLHIKDFLPQDIDGMKTACKIADAIIAISEFTKKDILQHLGAEEKKVHTIYNGISTWIKQIKDEVLLGRYREKYSLDKPFIFCLGMVPRKNIPRLLDAFAKSKCIKDILLVLAGSSGGHLPQYKQKVKELGIANYVRMYENVPEEDLSYFYSDAIGFIFPSLLEGFGLPLLEAQKCGCPVACSNTSALPEVVGNSALLFDPYSINEISSAIDKIAYDARLRESLTKKGYENLNRFSWDKSAKQMVRIYESL